MDPDAVRATDHVPHGGTDDADLLEFSANTNPERPDGVADVYCDAFDAAGRYPDDGYPDYRAAAAGVVDCDPERVVPTAGGMEAIRLAMATTLAPGDSALLPAPSFGEYDREVRLQGATPEFVAHDAVPDADPAPHALAVVCTPNNPTGEAADPEELRSFAARCRAADTTLLVDEAFLGYTDRPSLAGEPGVVVARSLTKLYGLPGLRMGYAVATGDDLDALRRARSPWSLSVPAARVGAHCLRDTAFVDRTRERVASERARLRDRLGAAYDVNPSDAPFLLCHVGERDPAAVVAQARERGVAVRDATTFRGLDAHVRVAVRTPDENDRLLAALGVDDADDGGTTDGD